MKIERIVRNRFYHLSDLSQEERDRHYELRREIINRGGDSIPAGASGRGSVHHFLEEEHCAFYEEGMGITPEPANDSLEIDYKSRVDATIVLLRLKVEYLNTRLDYLRRMNGNMAVRVPLEQSRNAMQHALDILIDGHTETGGTPHDYDQTGEAPD
jgi:hypothetical protein